MSEEELKRLYDAMGENSVTTGACAARETARLIMDSVYEFCLSKGADGLTAMTLAVTCFGNLFKGDVKK